MPDTHPAAKPSVPTLLAPPLPISRRAGVQAVAKGLRPEGFVASAKPEAVPRRGRPERPAAARSGKARVAAETAPAVPVAEAAPVQDAGLAVQGQGSRRVVRRRGEAEPLAVLPLRDIVVFPHMIVPLFVGREKSVRALGGGDEGGQADPAGGAEERRPGRSPADDIYRVGTVSTILQLLKLPDGTVKVLVEGGRRARITSFKETDSVFRGVPSRCPTRIPTSAELEALGRTVVRQFEQYIKLNKKIAPEVLVSLNQIEEPTSSPTPSPAT